MRTTIKLSKNLQQKILKHRSAAESHLTQLHSTVTQRLTSARHGLGDHVLRLKELRVAEVDGVWCLQITISFTLDPFAQFGLDSRFIKTLHARVQLAHAVDEAIKAAGEQVDLMSMEGVKINAKAELDRKMLEWLSQNEEAKMMASEVMDTDELAPLIAMALTFGSADLVIKTRSIMEIFNKDIRDGFEPYNDFLAEYEERRMIDSEGTLGMLTAQIVEMYSGVPPPVQSIYKELKAKIAGPHSVKVMIPTAEVAVTTTGFVNLYKFFPTPEEIESHPDYTAGGSDDDDGDW